jgi:hypothetical protein
MLDTISGQGSRHSDSTIHNMTACCGYDASQDLMKPVPSGVVWDAWVRWMVEHWEGLGMNSRARDVLGETLSAFLVCRKGIMATPRYA